MAQLDGLRGVSTDAEWHEIKNEKKLKPDDVIQVTIEEQPHWPRRNLMTNAEHQAMFVGDYAHGLRRTFRMVLPDGTPFAVGYYETKSGGLKQSFPQEFLPKPESDKS